MPDLPAVVQRLAIGGTSSTAEQRRFDSLVGQLGEARGLLASWQDAMTRYRADHVRVQRPLIAEWKAARRRWVLALGATARGGRWSRLEQDTFGRLVREACVQLLGDDGTTADADLKDLHFEWAAGEVDSARPARHAPMHIEPTTGANPGTAQAAQAEPAAHRQPPKRRGASPQRREGEARDATLAVRAVYRRLASGLHPDREPDPARQAEKTRLMQQVNQAYAANDLLSLLELQLRLEQVDATHAMAADERLLKHYNRLLAEQLARLRRETREAVNTFLADFGIDPAAASAPRRLAPALAQTNAALRAATGECLRELRLFDDPAWTRQWLKAQRQRLDDDDPLDDAPD